MSHFNEFGLVSILWYTSDRCRSAVWEIWVWCQKGNKGHR